VLDGAALPHLHVTLSDEAMHALGGHLVKGIVSATLEVTITVYPTEFTKKHSEEIGLNLYELPERLN
jgi:predicted DNA-binding protein with PD1-like motif